MYDPSQSCWRHPKVQENWKMVLAAVVLLLVGIELQLCFPEVAGGIDQHTTSHHEIVLYNKAVFIVVVPQLDWMKRLSGQFVAARYNKAVFIVVVPQLDWMKRLSGQFVAAR
uniref:(California timema) hypothetical protein n=1 Tax=Timema californicum TaxID=61474 RepID=A0A7R9PBF2_TIMCA|nr:unnamed protein product [Timema californicum]